MYRKIFRKQGKPLRFGDQIITTSSFFAIVNPVKTNFKNRDKFLNNFAKQAYIHGLSTVKKPSHIGMTDLSGIKELTFGMMVHIIALEKE
ncbi:hypothetical protein [Paenibacillus sp. FSL L8-0499]|uniref:hypothetical protein n=1 Tax=Paenibacillus sp. FSL L8-0499 TaxID=2975334 RepID=UPI0030F93B62